MADPVTALPEEELDATLPPPRALRLLHRRDFRRTYAAIVVSELGDSFHYVALMWFALVSAGPLGVLAVRLADSLPALVFGLHGGLVADRSDRRRVMVSADVARGAVLVPVAGLAGRLDLWMLVVAAFVVSRLQRVTSSPPTAPSSRPSSTATTSSPRTGSCARPPRRFASAVGRSPAACSCSCRSARSSS